jgi:hypothetical protein
MMHPRSDADAQTWIVWKMRCMHAAKFGEPPPPWPEPRGASSSSYEGPPTSEAAEIIDRALRALATRCDYAHLRMEPDDGTPQT